ncbi:hypothetical protein DASC09_042510 [Saccharomycopsis crataegensis]|uniref:Nuclear fusion protein KAR5 n=1 Tax=Saccharomycopsis crataegensis TaxID=43959 RepID=A0AAV5QQC6_9ASCO|nr:hypothetical protein DASC09_042510 [Saccharomycopsis crataegensis]
MDSLLFLYLLFYTNQCHGLTFSFFQTPNALSTTSHKTSEFSDITLASQQIDDELISTIITDLQKKYSTSIGMVEDNFDVSFPLYDTETIDTTCILKVLDPILDKCIYHYDTITDDFKAQIAASLTACQLNANHISVPRDCELLLSTTSQVSSVNYDRCIKALFESPQYWTTYDGCYKTVGYGCLQESFKYQSTKIIELHLNITKHYQKLNKEMTNNLKKYAIFKSEILQKVETLIKEEIMVKYEEFVTQAEVLNQRHMSVIQTNEARQIEKLNGLYWKNIEDNLSELDDLFFEKKLDMYHFFEVSKMTLSNSVDELRKSVQTSNREILNHSELFTKKLNSTMIKIERLESKFNFLVDFINGFDITAKFKKMATLVRFFIDYMNYFFIAAVICYSVFYYLFSKWVSFLVSPRSKTSLFKKLIKLLVCNMVAFLIGRSLVHCISDLRRNV